MVNNSVGGRLFPSLVLMSHHLLVTRRPCTSRHHICIHDKIERREVVASTVFLLPADKKVLFRTNLFLKKADFLCLIDKKKGSQSPLAGRKSEESMSLSLHSLPWRARIAICSYPTAKMWHGHWMVKDKGKTPERKGAKNKDSEARLGLNPTLHEELVGAQQKACWGSLDCSGI